MAEMLIESMEGSWDPSRYRDTHREKVEALIEQKSKGKKIVTHAAAPANKVIDLMEALNASIAASSGRPKSSTAAPKVDRQAKPAKRIAAAKSAPPKKAAASAKKATPQPATKTPRRKAS
jgi:DNA end-binding protein Ku